MCLGIGYGMFDETKAMQERYCEESDLALLELKGELMNHYKLFKVANGVYELREKSLVEQVVEEAMLKDNVKVEGVLSFRRREV